MINPIKSLQSRKQSKDSQNFERTKYGKQLAALKDSHKGEKCFVIGNGPSLTPEDLQILQDNHIISFATNRIYNMFDKTSWRPTYYVSEDINVIRNVKRYVEDNKPIVITVNFLHDTIPSDFVYMSNVKRYRYWRNRDDFADVKKIFTSNVQAPADDKSKVISFVKLVKCGWEHLDNSTIMLLRLLDILGVSKISIAGFDGYSYTENNYATKSLELSSLHDDPTEMNKELEEMLTDYQQTRVHQDTEISFITPSRFESCFR